MSRNVEGREFDADAIENFVVKLVLPALALILYLGAIVLANAIGTDHRRDAATWIPFTFATASPAVIFLYISKGRQVIRFRGYLVWIELAALAAAAFATHENYRGTQSYVIEGSAVVLLALAVAAPIATLVVVRWRTPRSDRIQLPLDSWDMRASLADLPHWSPPTTEGRRNEATKREIHEFETIALTRAALSRRSSIRWQRAQYGIGLPAALASGLAGASGVSSLRAAWRVVFGVVGLVGAGLASLSTALNAGRHAENTATTATSFESVAREAHAFRTTGEVQRAKQFLRHLLARLDALAGAPAPSTAPPSGHSSDSK